jgi:hypothetical protein
MQVLRTLLHQAWRGNPQHHLSNKCLVNLLFSTAQLEAAPPGRASVTTAVAVMTPQEATAAAASACASKAATTDSNTGNDEAVAAVSDGYRHDAAAVAATAAAALPDPEVLSAVIDQLILSTMPEHEQQQGGALNVEDLVRVLWSCCVFGSLDIAQFGWLLVAVTGSPWQRLGQEQLLVIKQGEVRGDQGYSIELYSYLCSLELLAFSLVSALLTQPPCGYQLTAY